jgi:hypothetical protein
MRQVKVTDAACTADYTLAPRDRGVYLLEFDFQGPRVCRLSCFEQIPQPDNSFANVRCPQPSVAP